MKKSVIIILLILVAIAAGRVIPGAGGGQANADTSIVNPNGASELSVLMREMQEYTSDERKKVLENEAASSSPASFGKLKTAEITDGMRKSDFYDDFADVYLSTVENYEDFGTQNDDDPDRVRHYNNMVSACLACHSQHCPGPVPVIRKLFLEDESSR